MQSLQNILPRLSSKQFSNCKTLGKVSLVSSSDFVFSIKFTNKNNLRSGSGPLNPSGYVKEYIGKTVFISGKSLRQKIISDRILLPVFTSLTVFPTEVQQVVGRLAVKTLCDSWLEHIYQKKFKFR